MTNRLKANDRSLGNWAVVHGFNRAMYSWKKPPYRENKKDATQSATWMHQSAIKSFTFPPWECSLETWNYEWMDCFWWIILWQNNICECRNGRRGLLRLNPKGQRDQQKVSGQRVLKTCKHTNIHYLVQLYTYAQMHLHTHMHRKTGRFARDGEQAHSSNNKDNILANKTYKNLDIFEIYKPRYCVFS